MRLIGETALFWGKAVLVRIKDEKLGGIVFYFFVSVPRIFGG